MTVPSITFKRRDNQLGIQSGNQDWNQLAMVGNCTGGTVAINTPGKYTRVQDVVAGFGKGPLVEDAVFKIENFGLALILVKTDFTTAGGYQTIDTTGVTGTSVVTTHTATQTYDESDVQINVTLGGVVGTGPITYTYSVDGGLTTSAPQSLGTLNTIVIPDVNAQFDLAAGNLATGDVIKCRTTQPLWNQAQLDAALLSLQNTQLQWDGVEIVGKCAGADVTAIETRMVSMENAEMERAAMCNVRSRTLIAGVVETEAAYLTAQSADFLNVIAPHVSVGYDYEDLQSPINFARYRRPCSWGLAARFATTRPGRDLAAVADGAFPSVIQIADANGNPKHHDERIFPGADDARFTTNRSWIKRQGVYLNNARLMSANGSDLVFMQFLRVSNLVMTILRAQLQLIESIDLLVDPGTGFILEEEAKDVEAVLNFALKTNVVDTRDASAVTASVSRTDNLLSTFKLTGSATIVSLAYPKQIVFDVGFKNPARNVVAFAP